MRWEGNRESDNVEDRRDQAGDGSGFRAGGRGIGLGGVVVALLVSWLFGINPLTVLNIMSGAPDGMSPPAQQAPAARSPADDRMARFVSTVLADTEDVWKAQFSAQGKTYQDPKLVLFRQATPTACGTGQSAMGPFYCPADQQVYIDLGFFQTLKDELGAPGEFAQAYVVAHQVGHHLQNQRGNSTQQDHLRGRVSQAEYNRLSVKLELQADCLAGVWAAQSNAARQTLEPGDVESALNAASRIGDDTLQKQSQGYAVPDSFTHGTSAQRMRWFRVGLRAGNLKACDTFSAANL